MPPLTEEGKFHKLVYLRYRGIILNTIYTMNIGDGLWMTRAFMNGKEVLVVGDVVVRQVVLLPGSVEIRQKVSEVMQDGKSSDRSKGPGSI